MTKGKSIFIILIILAIIGGIFCGMLFSAFPGGEIAEGLDKPKNGIINVLFLGTDEGGLRSDTIMVASLDTKRNTCSIMSVPRDTSVTINGARTKINSALAIGKEELTIKKVKEVTGLPIHYYLTLNFDAVEAIVDILGGVHFNVPQRMYYKDPTQNLLIDLQPGPQLLNGEDSVNLLRFRSYPTADLGRISVQQDFVKAAIKQKLKMKYIFKINDVIKEIKENINTNLSTGTIIKLATEFANLDSEDLKTYQMPCTPQMIGGVSYVICNREETAKLVSEEFMKTAPKTDKKSE